MTHFRPRLIHYVIVLSLFGWVALLGPTLAWVQYLHFEKPYLTFPVQPFPVVNSPVKSGGIVLVHIERCSSARIAHTYLVSRRLDPSIPGEPDIPLETKPSTIYPGCHNDDRAFPAPGKPGFYKFTGESEPAGTVKTFTVPWYSAEFEVIP